MSSGGLIATARPLAADPRSVPGDLRSVDRHAIDTAAIPCLPSRSDRECDTERKGVQNRSTSVLQGQTDVRPLT
jgi:hypothetical protein